MKDFKVIRRTTYEETYTVKGAKNKAHAMELIATSSGKAEMIDLVDISGFNHDYNKEVKSPRNKIEEIVDKA